MKLQYIIWIGFVMASCQSTEDSETLKQQVLEADRDFSKMAQEKGIEKAFIYYADERVIKPNPGQQPIVGKFALMESYRNNPPSGYTLTWKPLRAEASGNLAYTFGGYELVSKTKDGLRDSTQYGNYVSIWKRKKDGSWRYVLDTGNPTPGPVVLQ